MVEFLTIFSLIFTHFSSHIDTLCKICTHLDIFVYYFCFLSAKMVKNSLNSGIDVAIKVILRMNNINN